MMNGVFINTPIQSNNKSNLLYLDNSPAIPGSTGAQKKSASFKFFFYHIAFFITSLMLVLEREELEGS